MAEINWTREAQTWVKDIYDYIAQTIRKLPPELSTGFTKKRNYSSGIPKPDTSTKLDPLAQSEFFSMVIIESPI